MKFIRTRSCPQRLRRVAGVRVRNVKSSSGRLRCVQITGSFNSSEIAGTATLLSQCFRKRVTGTKSDVYAEFQRVLADSRDC